MGSTLDFFRAKAREEEEEKERAAGKAAPQTNKNSSGGTTQKKSTSTLDFFREKAAQEREENPQRFSSSQWAQTDEPFVSTAQSRSYIGDTFQRMSAMAETARNAAQEKQPTIAELSAQLLKAQDEEKAARNATTKYRGYGSWRYLTEEDIANQKAAEQVLADKTAQRQKLQAQIEALNDQRRYGDKTYEDNFFGQFGANYTQGRLQQDSSLAWNDYLNDPSEANKLRAEAVDAVLAEFQRNNEDTLADDATASILSQSLAGYLPQLMDQTKYSTAGGLTGATLGTAVPVVGTALGAKAGIVAGRGKYSYDTMRGAAYRGLRELGMDEETARAAASDEAIVSALIEMADTGVDIATLGVGKLINLVGKGGVKAVAGEAAETATKKFLKGLAGYGLNIGGEMVEEASQEAVSIANENRARRMMNPVYAHAFNTGEFDPSLAADVETGVWDLAKSAAGTAWDAVRGEDYDAAVRLWEAAKEGGKIAAMMGGATRAATGIANTAIENRTGAQMRNAGGDETVEALIESGLESAEGTESRVLAEKLKAKQEAGQSVSNTEVGRLYQANVRAMENETPADPVEQAARETVQAESEVSEETITQPTQSEKPATEPLRAEQSVPYNVMATNNPVRKAVLAQQEKDDPGYGKTGTATFRSIVEDSGRDVADVRAEFQSAYEAGMTNLPRELAALSTPVQEEAYNAGRQDYILSMSRENKGATVYGKDAGFIRSDASADLDTRTVETFQAMGKSLGAKIMMEEQVYGGKANGSYSGGVIRIAKDAANPYVVVAKHEVTHRMQDLAPKEYTQYRDYAVQVLSSERSSTGTTLVEAYQDRAAEAGVRLTAEQAMDEIAADFTEKILTDEKSLHDFVTHTKSSSKAREMGRKFFQAVREFINKVKRVFKGDKAKMDSAAKAEFGATIEQLEKAERLWKEAYRAAESNVKDGNAFVDTTTGENVQWSLRTKEPPKKVGIAYKVFFAKDGQLYPPMVANPGGAGTPVGVWLDADVGVAAAPSKTGRPQVKAGGKGTQGGSGSLAFRPGWHLGDLPLATQFNRKNPETGKKELFPADFVWAECEYAMDHDYQEEAMSYGYTENGKFRHSYAGLPRLPEDGYYRYRTNPNPDTVPWVITGAMRVKRILTDAETDKILRDAGVEPLKRQGGPIDLEKLGIKAGEQYSLKDSDYMKAVENGDMVTAQRMVDEAAKAAGYPAKLYHGTNAFGFTRVDLDVKEADGFSFWAANREDVSGTYTQYGRVRGITDEISDDAIDELVEEAVEEMDDAIGDFRRHVDRIFSEWVFGQTDNSYLHDIVDDANPEPGYGDGVYDVLDEIVSNAYYDYLEDNDEQYEDFGDWSENSEEAKALYDTIAKIEAIKSKLFNFDRGDVRGGIYALYANTDNMFVVDAKGNLWNELRPDGLPKIERGVFKDVPYMTRDVAKWARENGYDGVIFKNIKDNGQFGRTPAGDVYAFFKPDAQVKSADPVTYDDNGNVIPLSERFDENKQDIRFSLKETPIEDVRKAVDAGKPVSAKDEFRFSLKYDSEFMEAAIKTNDRFNRVPKAVMTEAARVRKAIADVFNDPKLADSLGLPPDIIGNTYIPNGSYSGTEENTTECIRTLAADELMDAVAEKLGRPLTVEDTIRISQEYWKYTDRPECLYCYVAMDRKAHREFLGSYLEQRDAAIQDVRNGMSREEAYQKFLDGRKDTGPMKKRFDMWMANMDKELITPADLASRASMERASGRGAAIKAQVNDALKYAQGASWAKKRISYTAYNNHILKWKKTRIDMLNSNYGLRLYSFSDFSPAFILENMQMVTDAAVRNLKILAYTKELDFVRIFAKTGMNINISVFGYNDGHGGVAQDGMQGADWAQAQELRKQYDNVGCTFVATNDEQIAWALDQDWIDVIIPFHMVRTGTKVADYFGWKNYTAMSSDTRTKEWTKADAKHILPPMHQNDKAKYLQACKDNHLAPRFKDWVDHPNYMKLVNETRRSEAKSKPVQPVFDEDAALESIDLMRRQGGYYQPIGGDRENMLDIAEEIAESMQFSLKGQSDLLAENAKLRKVHQTLREQFAVTKFEKADKKALDQFAKELLKDWKSGADINETREALDNFYTFVREFTKSDDPDFAELEKQAYAIATPIVENVVEIDDTEYQEYKELRNYIRTTGITLPKDLEHDLGEYESLNDFRKAYFGRIRLVKGGREVSSFYEELAGMYPGLFDVEEHSNPADQLVHIGQVLDDLKPTEVNPHSHNMREVTTWLATDIISRLYDLPQAKPTFGDKVKGKVPKAITGGLDEMGSLLEQQEKRLEQAETEGRRAQRELAEAKSYGNALITSNKQLKRELEQAKADVAKIIEASRKKQQETIAGQRMAAGREMEKLKRKQKEKLAKASETKQRQVMRAKILRHTTQLSKKLLHASDRNHIPQELQGIVAKLLESINMESNYTYDSQTDSYKKNDLGSPTMRTRLFSNLRKTYGELANELTIDPDLLGDDGLLAEVIGMADLRMADMTLPELETVWKAIRAIEASIQSADITFNQSRWGTISEAANALRAENADKKDKLELDGPGGSLGKLQKLTGIDMMTPEAYFHRLGKSGDALFRMMRDAQDDHIRKMKAVSDFTHEALKGVNVKKLENQMHTVKLGGQDVKLSTAQIMELYVLLNREQAREHIMLGGILPDVVSKGGLKKISRAEPVRGVQMSELLAAFRLLSEEQIAVAKKLQDYASTELSKWGNEAAMKVYNYEKFGEKAYWPIRVNKQEVQSNVQKDTQVTSVGGRGFTKGTKPHANNSVRIGSIFDTFATHSSEMATYAAWLAPMEDINRIRNYTFKEAGATTGTVKGIIDRVHGKNGTTYLAKLMADLSNGVKGTHSETAYMSALVGNYKAASVGANLRVIIQQPTAMLRAMDMIGPQYLVAGMRPANGWKKAKQYAPIAQWKDWGYFDINTGRQMKDVLFDSDSALDKVKSASMWGAGAADSLSWGILWNAVETETRHKHKDLKGEDFYKAVAERFNEIVDHTQVVDGILQRSQIMRSADGLTKMATSFMGEPTKQYNMMMGAAYDATHGNRDQRRAGKKRFMRAAVTLTISGVANAMAQAIMDAVRDDDREKDYWEKWFAALTGISGDEETTGELVKNVVLEGNLGGTFNPATYIPFVKDIVSIIQGYDVSRMDMESIEKTLTASKNMIQALSGEGKYTIGSASAALFAEVARMAGVPVANFKREVKSFAMLAANETDNYLMQYRMEKAALTLNYSSNKKVFMDILFKAYQNDPEAYEIIRADMIAEDKFGSDDQTTEEYIDSQIEKRELKGGLDAAGVDSTGDYYDKMFQELLEGDMDEYMDMLGNLNATGVVDVSTVETAMRSRANKAEMDPDDYNDLLAAAGLKLKFDVEDMDEDRYSIDDLTMSQYTDFVGERGDLVDDIISEFDRRGFGSLDKETANALLSAAYSFAAETALERASGGEYESDTKWINLAQEADEIGLTAAEYIMLKEEYSAGALAAEGLYEAYDATGMDAALYLEMNKALGDIKADKNAAGKTITDSRKRKVQDYLNSMGLTYEEYLWMMGREYSSIKKSAEYKSVFGG